MPPRIKKAMTHNTVVLQRLYKDAPTDRNGEIILQIATMNGYADAVLHVAMKKDCVTSYCLTTDGEWLVNCENTPIDLEGDIHLVIVEIKRKSVSDVQSVTMEVRSNVKTATEIMDWIQQSHKAYNEHKCKALTCQPCIFEQHNRGSDDVRGNPYDDPYQRRQFELISAKKYLSFIKCPFQSNKTFDSLVGKEASMVHDRVKFFMENKEWYDKKGVPYRLTIMLSGASGSGKSSCIKAIVNMTQRHIVNVNFNNIQTGTQLRRLFQSDDLHVFAGDEGADVDHVRIPLNQRIYVLEEIDAITNGGIVQDRRLQPNSMITKPPASANDAISLADILQVLDGTMETPGRIVIITSNYPDKLDRALVRPGRVDLSIKFTNATQESTAELYERLMDVPFPKEQVCYLPSGDISLADVTEAVFRNFGKPVSCFIEDTCSIALQKREQEKMIDEYISQQLVANPCDNLETEFALPKSTPLQPSNFIG